MSYTPHTPPVAGRRRGQSGNGSRVHTAESHKSNYSQATRLTVPYDEASNAARSDISRGSNSSLRGNSNVRVVARVRPLTEREQGVGSFSCVNVTNGNSMRLTAPPANDTQKGIEKNYAFDCILDPHVSQTTVFNASGIQVLVKSALKGYASTCLAYGQTGSGKTYTMSGMEERIVANGFRSPDSDGLIPRCLKMIFQEINQQPHKTFVVKASFMEIYNEQVLDLLKMDGKPLHVRLHPAEGFFVENQLVVECNNAEDLLVVAAEGHKNRHVASHELNKDSSRSHSVMSVYIESSAPSADGGDPIVKNGKISFVDLAGSENVKQSRSEGKHLKETGNINKSLFVLGKVISALGDIHTGKKPRSYHVPYRDSVLTKLLMNSLGGRGLSMIIACCSPAHIHIDETIRTLNYATRARNIKNKPTVQMDPKDRIIEELKRDIKRLRSENTYIRRIAQDANLTLPPPSTLSYKGGDGSGMGGVGVGGYDEMKREREEYKQNGSVNGDYHGQPVAHYNNGHSMSVYESDPQPPSPMSPSPSYGRRRSGFSQLSVNIHSTPQSPSRHSPRSPLSLSGASGIGSGGSVDQLLQENNTLKKRLQDVERIFIGRNDVQLWDDNRQQRISHSAHSASRPAKSTSDDFNPYKAENEKLRAQLVNIRSKNQELLQQVQHMGRTSSMQTTHSDVKSTYHAKHNVKKETHENFQLKKANTALERQVNTYLRRESCLNSIDSQMSEFLREKGYNEFVESIEEEKKKMMEAYDPLSLSNSRSSTRNSAKLAPRSPSSRSPSSRSPSSISNGASSPSSHDS